MLVQTLQPKRTRREQGASSAEGCGAASATGKPEVAPAAWGSCSSTVTLQPRWAKASATPAPTMPAPTTAQRRDTVWAIKRWGT